MIKRQFNFRSEPRASSVVTRIILGFYLLLLGLARASGGYSIEVHVETSPGTNRYTWTVHNEDQSWGLDQFAVEVPDQTRVLAFTVPPPYSNPDTNAYWIMQERKEAWVDPHDGMTVTPLPRAGWKWLLWHGMESPSVYPPGTTVTFSLATDSSVKPGIVHGVAATYTPQNNPHYYLPWQEQITGPSTVDSVKLELAAPSNHAEAVPVANPTTAPAPTSPQLYAFGAIELYWASEINRVYRVQWTSSLVQPQWINIGPLVAGTGTNVSIFDSTREHPQGFYRVQIVQ